MIQQAASIFMVAYFSLLSVHIQMFNWHVQPGVTENQSSLLFFNTLWQAIIYWQAHSCNSLSVFRALSSSEAKSTNLHQELWTGKFHRCDWMRNGELQHFHQVITEQRPKFSLLSKVALSGHRYSLGQNWKAAGPPWFTCAERHIQHKSEKPVLRTVPEEWRC